MTLTGGKPDRPGLHAALRGAFGAMSGRFPRSWTHVSRRSQQNAPRHPHPLMSFQSTMIPIADVMNQSNDHKTVWGWMAYKDVLPHTAPHVTEFCYFISEVAEKGDSPKPDQSGGAFHHIQLSWTLCDRHNCVDTSCEDYDLVTAPLK